MGVLDNRQMDEGGYTTTEQVGSVVTGQVASSVKETTADNLNGAINPKEQKLEDLRKLRENLVNIIHECNFPKIYVPNDELGYFTDPSAIDIKDMVEKGIKISDKMVKGVFYMNPCFCLSLYLISKLKEIYPSLAKNIKLNVELFKINGYPSAHAFITIEDKNGDPLIIDYARNNDVYIYRGKYHNYSDGVQPFLENQEETSIVQIPANTFKDGDGIVSIAKKNEEKISKDFPGLTSDFIEGMLNGRTKGWKKDNDKLGINYKNWHDKYGDSPVYCFENSKDEEQNHKRIKLKIESTNPLKIYLMESEGKEGNCTWSELEIKNTKPLEIYKKDGDNSIINFQNEFINNFLASIVNK